MEPREALRSEVVQAKTVALGKDATSGIEHLAVLEILTEDLVPIVQMAAASNGLRAIPAPDDAQAVHVQANDVTHNRKFGSQRRM
jgi:hypothetical protein